jgi:hypothetical protein
VNAARLWVLGSAVGCFVAGMAGGLALPDVMHACCAQDPQDPDAAYVQRMTEDFRLDPAQQRSLRMVLESCQRQELEVFHRARYESLPESLKNQLREARAQKEQRIRVLLTPEQRRLYDSKVRTADNR